MSDDKDYDVGAGADTGDEPENDMNIKIIAIPETQKGTERDGVRVLPVPKRLEKTIEKILVRPSGDVFVYAKERLDDCVLRWGDCEIGLRWNDFRKPERAEGTLTESQMQKRATQ